jgi:hypothetical protein
MGFYGVLIFMQCASLVKDVKNIAVVDMCVCPSCMGIVCRNLVQHVVLIDCIPRLMR